MLQKLILQCQLVPHTVDDILYIISVAAYCIGDRYMLLVCNQFSKQTNDTRTVASLVLYHRLMNRTAACFLSGKANTFKNVNLVSIVHLQEDRFVRTNRIVKKYLHQCVPVLLAYPVLFRQMTIEYLHLVRQFFCQRLVQIYIV